MNTKYLQILFLLIHFYFLLIVPGCGSPFPIIELSKEYNFSSKESIAVYVVSSGNKVQDDIYSRVLRYDLISRGYNVVNPFSSASDEIVFSTELTHREIADSLMILNSSSAIDAFLIVRLKWDSVFFALDFIEFSSNWGLFTTYLGTSVLRLSSELVIFDRELLQPIKSVSAIDTLRIFEDEGADRVYFEHPWMVAARQIEKIFKDIPVCEVDNYKPSSYRFPVSLLVDKSYRNAFPSTWKERLERRIVYANDILKLKFDIELIITEFKEWNSHFEISLENVFNKIPKKTTPDSKHITLGITFNDQLKRNWEERAYIGLAKPLGTKAVVTAQPAFHELGFWNPLEEAISIVHEIAHLLGAIHVKDESSIMYPYSGNFSFEFDETNLTIISSMRENYLTESQQESIMRYIGELIKLRKFKTGNNIPILVTIARVCEDVSMLNPSNTLEIDKPSFNVSKYVKDSLYVSAVSGLLALKEHNMDKAKDLFLQVLEQEPDFAEVHWYLSLALRQSGNFEEADKHLKMAYPFKLSWILTE